MERLAEGMQASDSPADQVQCVDAIDGARRVQRIVRELRTFAGSPRDEGERADAVAALDAALKLADNELRFRARVERHVEPVACVKANEPRLTQGSEPAAQRGACDSGARGSAERGAGDCARGGRRGAIRN